MDKLDKLIDAKLKEQFANPNPFPHTPSDPTWNTGIYTPSVPIKDRRDVDDEEEEEKEKKLEEAPIPFQPPYPGGKPGGMPEEEDKKSEKTLAPEDIQKILFGEEEKPSNKLKEERDLIWAYKMYLLDELDSSTVLRESLKVSENEKMRDFIKSLKVEQVITILEAGPFDFDIDAPQTLNQLQGALDDILRGADPEVVVKKLNAPQHKSGISVRGKIVAGVSIAALVAVIGYLLYRRYRNKCNQICKDSKDIDCLKKCRIASIRGVIMKLNTEKGKCRDRKCVEKFDKHIRKWQEKLAKIR